MLITDHSIPMVYGISLAHYNELNKRADLADLGIEYNETNHLYNAPNDIIEFLKGYLGTQEDTYKDDFKFKVHPKTTSKTILSINSWVRTDELLEWINLFKGFNIKDIESINLGYITGLHSPLDTTGTNRMMAHSGDYYEVWVKIKYKG